MAWVVIALCVAGCVYMWTTFKSLPGEAMFACVCWAVTFSIDLNVFVLALVLFTMSYIYLVRIGDSIEKDSGRTSYSKIDSFKKAQLKGWSDMSKALSKNGGNITVTVV